MRVALAVVLASLVASSAAVAATSQRPVLGLRGDLVRGTHFRPAEKVTVFAAGVKYVIRTDARGTFTLLVHGLAKKSSRCGGGIVIQALGAPGERVTLAMGGLDCADVGTT
jgi:hypothetical protein